MSTAKTVKISLVFLQNGVWWACQWSFIGPPKAKRFIFDKLTPFPSEAELGTDWTIDAKTWYGKRSARDASLLFTRIASFDESKCFIFFVCVFFKCGTESGKSWSHFVHRQNQKKVTKNRMSRIISLGQIINAKESLKAISGNWNQVNNAYIVQNYPQDSKTFQMP